VKLVTHWIDASLKKTYHSLRREAAFFKKKKIKNDITDEFDLLEKLYSDICEHPYTGLGHPHILGHGYSGWWSRHVDNVHRVVYKVDSSKGFLYIREMSFDYHSKSSMLDNASFLSSASSLDEDADIDKIIEGATSEGWEDEARDYVYSHTPMDKVIESLANDPDS